MINFTFTKKDDKFDKVWRYADPFVGSLDLRKVELPDPPPERITVTVEWGSAATSA